MGRDRVYSTAAERQKAYRLRAIPAEKAVQTIPPKKPGRRSRREQLAEIEIRLKNLLTSYENWRLPQSFEGTIQAEKLNDTIEKLSSAVELLAELDPPLGFGRD